MDFGPQTFSAYLFAIAKVNQCFFSIFLMFGQQRSDCLGLLITPIIDLEATDMAVNRIITYIPRIS